MENNQDQMNKRTDKNLSSSTPHELVMRHIKNPDESVTDEEINNLNLNDDEAGSSDASDSIPVSKTEKAEADELADDLGEDNTCMSYQANI